MTCFADTVSARRPIRRLVWIRYGERLAAFACLAFCTLASAQMVVVDQAEAGRIARQNGWLLRADSPSGRTIELRYLFDGRPAYYSTTNLDAADSVSSDECWPGGSTGLGLSGAGVTLGVWDGGRVRSTHQEFNGRVAQQDGLTGGLVSHSTHVAGTMIAAGVVAQAKGMSFEANLHAWTFSGDESEMSAAAANGLLASNHSYGLITGWIFDDLGAGVGWYWTGDTTVSQVEDYFFGFYSYQAASWDVIAYEKPHYLMVVSAGNDRDDGVAPGTQHFVFQNGAWVLSTTTRNPDNNNGYDSLSHASGAKNVLSVGAVNDVYGGYSVPASVVMSSFSGWGPTDDGRIKPDIVANGVSLYSSIASSNSAYDRYSGTSMSAPNTTGSLGLLIQHYRNTHSGRDMQAATLKGLVIHTADEAGSFAGPDYAFGWGLLNTASAAAQVSRDEANTGAIQELALGNDQIIEQAWTYSGAGAIRATISWTDPPGTPPAPAVDPTDKMLVNDLDLRVIGPDATVYEPWTLDVANPSAASAPGDNDVDNVEMVQIDSPGAGTYTIRITHKGVLTDGLQRVSMLLSGMQPGADVEGACCQQETCAATTTEGTCLGSGGTWYGGADCATFSCPAYGACCLGCGAQSVCDERPRLECVSVGGAWTAGITCQDTSCTAQGDDCDTDIIPVTDGAYPVDNRCAQTDGPGSVSCESGLQSFNHDVWFAYTASCTGTMTASMCSDADYDAIMAIYSNESATCPCPTTSSTQIGPCGDDSCGVGGGPPVLNIDVTQGNCYTIRIGGWSSASGTGTLDISCEASGCRPASAPLPDPGVSEPPPLRNRTLSLVPTNAGVVTALRVTPTFLDGFDASAAPTLWAGPPQIFPNEDTSYEPPGDMFLASGLQCTPYFTDWGWVDLLYIYSAEILPNSTYQIQAVQELCIDQLDNEAIYSDPLIAATGVWGDVTAPYASDLIAPQPDFTDIAAVVAKFTAAPGSIHKASAQLQPNVVFPSRPVDFKDISAAVGAFADTPYPFAGPCGCPPVISCNATGCANDLDCGNGLCVDGFCADQCGRCAP